MSSTAPGGRRPSWLREPSTRLWNILRWGCIGYFCLLMLICADFAVHGAIGRYAGLSCPSGCLIDYSNLIGSYLPQPSYPAESFDYPYWLRLCVLGVFVVWFRWINETRPEEYRGDEKEEEKK